MTDDSLILFEDERAARFEPVALTRSVAQLRMGVWTHRERWQQYFPDRSLSLICRGFLQDVETESRDWQSVNEPPAAGLFVSAALGRPGVGILEAIRELEEGEALLAGDRLLAARACRDRAARLAGALQDILGAAPAGPSPDWTSILTQNRMKLTEESRGKVPETLVDLMHGTAEAIDDDFQAYVSLMPPPDPAEFPGVHFVCPERIRLVAGVRIAPGAVLDAREGSILLGPETRVLANAVLCGPLSAGAGCLIRPQASLAEGVSLGPVCKMGGEVDATIAQGYSNKQHAGFLGHSYLGSWVNLGAATDTSDLKNDYGSVQIVIAGSKIDTGSRHVGSLIGDHSKTAIHTRLNTGTAIGVSVNVFGSGFPPKEVPSFTWGGGAAWQEYRLEKALRVASTVSSRRDIELSAAQEALLTRIHEMTRERREAFLRP